MGKTRIGQWQVLKGMDRNQVGAIENDTREKTIDKSYNIFLSKSEK